MSYETSVQRLQEIVSALSSGSRPLSESLGLFQEGVKLLREADEELSAVEAAAGELLDVAAENFDTYSSER